MVGVPALPLFSHAWTLRAAVIPAKAGIYSANLRKCAVDGLDSRFRGNNCAPNHTTTALLQLLTPRAPFGILRTRGSISILDNASDEIC